MSRRSRFSLPDRSDDRGAVAVFFAIFLIVFMILLAFVVDMGRVYTEKAALQQAADAAALAAAQDLTLSTSCTGQPQQGSGDAACQTAGNYVVSNGFTRAATVLFSEPGTNKIAVQITNVVPSTFARFAGVASQTVTARAVASKSTSGGAGGYTIFTEGTVDFLGNVTINGSVYAGSSVDLGGSSRVTGNLVAGAIGPGRNVTGADRVDGSVWAYGTINPSGANRFPNTTTAPVTAQTVTDYALNTVHLQARLDADALLTAPQKTVDPSGACTPLSTTVFLDCPGSGRSVDLKDIGAGSYPNLRTVRVESFTGTGNNVVGSWSTPPGPMLLWATSTSATAFNLAGNGTVNGYLYAPDGGYASTGGRTINGRIMTKLTASGAGNPNPTNANAFETTNFGSSGVSLTE